MQYAGHLAIFIPNMTIPIYDVTASGVIGTIGTSGEGGLSGARGVVGAEGIIGAREIIGAIVASGKRGTSGIIDAGCIDAEQTEMLR